MGIAAAMGAALVPHGTRIRWKSLPRAALAVGLAAILLHGILQPAAWSLGASSRLFLVGLGCFAWIQVLALTKRVPFGWMMAVAALTLAGAALLPAKPFSGIMIAAAFAVAGLCITARIMEYLPRPANKSSRRHNTRR